MLFAVIIRRVVVVEKRQTVQSVRTCQTGFPNPYQRFISLSKAKKMYDSKLELLLIAKRMGGKPPRFDEEESGA